MLDQGDIQGGAREQAAAADGEKAEHVHHLQKRRHLLGGLFRRDDRMYLEIDEITPVRHPLVEKRTLVRFHQLVATLELVIDPTRDVDEALRRQTASVAKAAIYGHSVVVLEMLYHHVQRLRHRQPPMERRYSDGGTSRRARWNHATS